MATPPVHNGCGEYWIFEENRPIGGSFRCHSLAVWNKDGTFASAYTNVLVCAQAADDPQKRKAARKLLAAHFEDQTAVFSTQVLQEYFVAVTRTGLPAENAQQHLATYAQANVVQVTTELILAAIDLHRLHRVSFRDALIVRSPRAAGCSVVFSEDMRHGQSYDGW